MVAVWWDYTTFSELFAHSPREAFEYRKRILWEEIPTEYLTEDEKNGVKSEINTDELIEEIQELEITRDSVIEILKASWIKYFQWAKTEKLIELAIANNLL